MRFGIRVVFMVGVFIIVSLLRTNGSLALPTAMALATRPFLSY
jgi:hypothetical protein